MKTTKVYEVLELLKEAMESEDWSLVEDAIKYVSDEVGEPYPNEEED